MDLALSFIVAVAAGVVCHYIIKWLDGDKQPVTSLWIQTFPHKNQEQKNPRMALRGFFVAVHYGIALSFCLLALQHMQFNNTICNFNRKWVCPCFSCLFMLYYHPLPNPKKQGLTRVSPISGVRSYTYCICLPRHSSDVHASMAARLIAARK